MYANRSYSLLPLTCGEARRWARRFRKLGFSPVTMHHTDWDEFGRPADGFCLRCAWPYDSADLPDDLYQFLSEYDEGVPAVRRVTCCHDAMALLAQFQAVRLGMGSTPIPVANRRDTCSPVVPVTHIAFDYDDWPPYTQIHPDWGDSDWQPHGPRSVF